MDERAVTVLVQHAQLFPAEWNELGQTNASVAL